MNWSGSEFHPDFFVLDLDLVLLQLDRGQVLALARDHVEFPLVERAGDHGPFELPFPEGAARVRAPVLRRVDLSADVVDGARRPVEIDLASAPLEQILDSSDLPEFGGGRLRSARIGD